MPDKKVWIGGAPPKSQLDVVTLPPEIEGGQVFKATIASKTIPYTFPNGALRSTAAAAIVALWESSDIPEFDEITPTDNGDGSFNLTGLLGQPFIVSFVIGDGANEIQVITIGNNPSGGTFTLTFDGQTTVTLAHNATAATVQTALEGLSNIEVGDIAVTGPDGGPYPVQFMGNYANTDVAAIDGDSTNLLGTDEVQIITLTTASGGTFTLSFGGQTTVAIVHNATAATVQAELESLSTIGAGNAIVSGPDGGPYTVTLQNALGKTDVAMITVDDSLLTGVLDANVAQTTPGGDGGDEDWTVIGESTGGVTGYHRLNGNVAVTGGTFDLRIYLDSGDGNFNLFDLQDIPFDVTPPELQELIDAWGNTNLPDNQKGMVLLSGFGGVPLGVNDRLSDGDSFQFNIPVAFGEALFQSPIIALGATNLVGGAFTGGSPVNPDYGSGGLNYGSDNWAVIVSGEQTGWMAYNTTAATVQAELEALPNIGAGNIEVTSMGSNGIGGGGFRFKFKGALSNQATGFSILGVNALGEDNTQFLIFSNWTGSTGTAEVQTLSITGSPVSGTFNLSFGGEDTSILNHNATAASVQTALEALPNIGAGNVVCTGGPLPDTPVVITFAGSLSGINHTDITVIASVVIESVKGGNAPTVEVATTQAPVSHVTSVNAEGPNDWNTPANWDTNELPVATDDLDFYDGTDVLYGLDQSAIQYGRVQTYERGPKIGLPRRNANYFEYKERYLKLNATEIILDSNSDRTNIDIGTSNPKIEVRNTGAGEDGELAVQIIGVNAVNTAELLVLDGEVAVAFHPKEEAYFKRITEREGDLFLGPGVSYAELVKTGGDITSDRSELAGPATL